MNAIKHITAIAIIACMFMGIHAHANKVFSQHEDWSVIELTDWTDDSKTYITQSSDATIRQAHWPYDGPFNLQYTCDRKSLYLDIFADGNNLRYGEKLGRVKFDDGSVNDAFRMTEWTTNDNYLALSPSKWHWRKMVEGNRMRVWIPYHGGDVIVDFSLAGFVAAAKRVETLDGCKNSVMVAAGIKSN